MNKPTNTLAPTAQKQSRLSQYLEQASIKASLANSMGADKAQGFIAGILACSTTNLELQKCDYQTVVSAGMIAAALELPLSPQLGYCYLVPYEDRKERTHHSNIHSRLQGLYSTRRTVRAISQAYCP